MISRALSPRRFGKRQNEYAAAVLAFREAFSRDECRNLRELAASLPAAPEVGVYPAPPRPTRRATTRILDLGACAWVAKRLIGLAKSANERFAFDIENAVEPVFVVSYGIGDFFDWHSDLADAQESRRKISISVQLSDPTGYEGGELQVVSTQELGPIAEIGTMICFPAHLAHRVTPVTSGERLALVTWIQGPPFR